MKPFCPLPLWLLLAALLTGMALAGGCALDQIVTVDVPPNTRAHFRETRDTSVLSTLSRRDARILRAGGGRRLEARIKAQRADHAANSDTAGAHLAQTLRSDLGEMIQPLILHVHGHGEEDTATVQYGDR